MPAAEQTVLRSYSAEQFVSNNGGAVSVTGEGVLIVTDPRSGAMSASLQLGEEAQADGLRVRIRARVSEGAFVIVSTHANFESGYQPQTQLLPAGLEQTVEIPVDRGGLPVLVISNGSTTGPSTGVITAVDLVRG